MQSQLSRVSALNKTSLETWLEAAQVVADGAEKIARVQFDTLKNVLREGTQRGRTLAEANSLAEFPARARKSVARAAERTLDYTQTIYDTARATGVELLTLAQDRSTALRQGWFEAWEDLADATPGGKTGGTKAVIDSTRATVEAVAEGFARSAKQTLELADAMVQTTSTSAAQAIGSMAQTQAS